MGLQSFLDNKYIRLLAMSLVIIIALTFIQDFADFLDDNSDKVVKLGVNQHCDPVAGICSASIVNNGEFQRISFGIKEKITPSKDFPMTVIATGFDFEGIQSISVSFEMHEQELEQQRITLTPDRSTHQVVPEKWDANARLPVAPENRFDWLAVIRLKSSKKEYQAEFPFTSR